MTSAHSLASFRNSCVQIPVHPVTSLPISELERVEETKERKKHSPNALRKPKVSFTTDHIEIESQEEGESQEEQENESNEVIKLVDEDKLYFYELEKLRKENEKNLARLKRLYEDEKHRYNISHVSGVNSSTQIESYGDSVITRNYINAITSASEMLDIDSLSSSDDELDERLKVHAPDDHVNILPNQDADFRGRESSYDVISQMWENFSVDEYAPYTPQKRKSNAWSPAITIPEPFSMTVREEKTKHRKSKRIEKIEEEKLKKKLAEDAELQKKITPVPIPPSTFLPLYEELIKQKEMKQQHLKDLYIEMLKASEKPFSFTKREEAKQEYKKMTSLNTKPKHRKTRFKANPFPEKIFENSLADKKAEEELYRKIKIKLRSQEMLTSSSLPNNMKLYRASKSHSRKNIEDPCTFAPLVHNYIPNFEELQQKFENELDQRKQQMTPTICEPFKLRTADVPVRRKKFQESQKINENIDNLEKSPLKTKRKSLSKSYNFTSNVTSPSVNVSKNQENIYLPPYRQTETVRLRQNHLRNSRSFDRSMKHSPANTTPHRKNSRKQSKEKRELQNMVTRKSLVNDVSLNRETKFEEKLQNFKEMDAQRKKEYKAYLKEMNARVKERPLLFEQVSKANAAIKAQKRYEDILERSGIGKDLFHSIMSNSLDATRNVHSQDDNLSNDGSYSPPRSESYRQEGSRASSRQLSDNDDISENDDVTDENVSDDDDVSEVESADDGKYDDTFDIDK